jgi:peptide deformylase
MLLKIYQTGQPILRKASKRVTKSQLSSKATQDLIDLLIDTLRDSPGVGLAAPQVGESLQIVIAEDKASYQETVPENLRLEQGRKPIALKVLVNPFIEAVGTATALYFEGCLSIDGYVGAVERYKAVRVSAIDRHGKAISYTAHGWQARILQHEADHLAGRLYTDRMISESFCNIKNFSMTWRKSLEKDIRKAFNQDKE